MRHIRVLSDVPVSRNWHKTVSKLYQTSDRTLKGIVQRLRFSGFILYPLSFFLYNPFKTLPTPYLKMKETGKKNLLAIERRGGGLIFFCKGKNIFKSFARIYILRPPSPPLPPILSQILKPPLFFSSPAPFLLKWLLLKSIQMQECPKSI